MVLVVKNLPISAEDEIDEGSIPGLGRSPGDGHGNRLVDTGGCRVAVHGVAKSWM